MTLFIIKSSLCLVVLLGIYLLFLEREKMHTFNRFYLLFALLLGLSIPFIYIDTGSTKLITEKPAEVLETISITSSEFVEEVFEPKQQKVQELKAIPKQSIQPVQAPAQTKEIEVTTGQEYSSEKQSVAPARVSERSSETASNSNVPLVSLKDVPQIIYGLGFLLFLIRFANGLLSFYRKRRSNESVEYDSAKVVLVDEETVPHTFLNTIYVNKEQFESGELCRQILDHELTHAKQKHSLDVIFIEVLRIIFWFNPVFYFYKRAIQINHEFLADESVISKTQDSVSYQKLLLDSIFPSYQTSLASTFNYSLAKKRFKMMVKKSSFWVTASKKVILIPVVLSLGLIFCTKSNHSDLPLYNTGSFPNVTNRNIVYEEPELIWKTKEIDGVKKDGYSLVSEDEPFTGVQELRLVKNDKVFQTVTYKDGIHYKTTTYYDSTGVTDYKTSEDRPIVKDEIIIGNEHVEYVDGKEILQYQSIDAQKTKDGYGFFRTWYDSGQLRSETKSRDNFWLQGLMTNYDESGEIVYQVRGINNVIVELLVYDADQEPSSNRKTFEIIGELYTEPFFRPPYTSVDKRVLNQFEEYISRPEEERTYYDEEGKLYTGKWTVTRTDMEGLYAEYEFSDGLLIKEVQYRRDPIEKEIVEDERKINKFENGKLKSSKIYKKGTLTLIIEYYPEYFFVQEFEGERIRKEYKVLKNTPIHDAYTGSYIEYNEEGEITVQKLYDDEGNEITNKD